jgi:hypothetical protein
MLADVTIPTRKPSAFWLLFSFVLAMAWASSAGAATPQSDSQNKSLDVRSSVGDLHLGADADARKTGLPLYPGARVKTDNNNDDKVNLGILTEAFGLKLVVANYESDDAASKVIDFYRDKLGKYGKVLECHSQKRGDVDFDDDSKDSKDSKQLKCEGDNRGPVTELKVGTENNQHVVSVEPHEAGRGSTFALVYVHTRGKQGDI